VITGPQGGSVLPDVLAPGLDIVFCGTAAGTASALQRAYYAGPGNSFWPTLYRVKLTPRQLLPREYGDILQWKLGLTDLAKQVFGGDGVLAKNHFDTARLYRLIEEYRPGVVAFTSKRAAGEFLRHDVGYGLQAEVVAASRLFVLPSPSGAARGHWDLGPWAELARLRNAGAGMPADLMGPPALDAARPPRVVSRPRSRRP
jgi:TDG/mug DNA glycosylase family protein